MTLPGLRNIEAAKQLLRTDLAVRSDYGLEILQNAKKFNRKSIHDLAALTGTFSKD